MNFLAQSASKDPAAAAVFRQLQQQARRDGDDQGRLISTEEYLVRHALESFLDRLTQTRHAEHFILKGGVLLAAYGIRRPTKDVDAEAVAVALTPEKLKQVLIDVADVATQDGVVFDLDTISVTEIREDAEYSGLRAKVQVYIATARQWITWDVSTGDPIVPQARTIQVPRVLGEPIALCGYPPELIVAEKGVTILQRGVTSTRWRDYVDIVQVAKSYPLDAAALVQAVRAVAAFRNVTVAPAAPLLAGYGEVSQPKWQAWRRKAGVAALCEPLLDDQVRLVCGVVDPIFEAAAARS